MRRSVHILAWTLILFMATGVVAGAEAAASIGIIGGADGPTAIYTAAAGSEDAGADDAMSDGGDPSDEGMTPIIDGEAPTDDITDEEAMGENTLAPSPSPTPSPTAAPVVNADFDIEVEMGYNGLVVMNRWSPSFVTITNHGPDFDGTLGVNVFHTQTEYDRYELPVSVASGASKRVQLSFKPMTRQDMYAFELTRGGAIVAEKRVAPTKLASPETVTVGLLSAEPEALAFFAQRANGLDTLRGEVWTPISLTADSFPNNRELFTAFSILVVDGVDMRTLSQPQQDALTAWLLDGGFVIVSGGAKAAAGYPFFSAWTELESGAPFESEDDITPHLISYAQIKGQPLEESVWINALPGTGALIADEAGHGLLRRDRAGSGSIYTAAFDLGSKQMSTWPSMSGFWPRMLRQSAPTDYQRMLDTLEQLRWGGNDYYSAQSLIQSMTLENNDSALPILLLLAAYLLIVGFGGYWVLKKMDRREWLWVAAPVSALVFALLFLLLSGKTAMNSPAALTATRISLDGDKAQTMTYIGVATPDGGELLIETDRAELPVVQRDQNYWYDDSYNVIDRKYRPLNMRQRYRLGARPAVGFATTDPWDAKLLQLSYLDGAEGSLDVSMWMDVDGMRGEAVNNTPYTMSGCLAITSFGFSNIGELLPGQSATFALLYPKEAIVLDPDKPFYPEPNTLYSTLDLDASTISTGRYYMGSFYEDLSTATFGNDNQQPTPEQQKRYSLVQMFNNSWSFYESTQSFYFFAFNDQIGQVAVSINGKPVERTAHAAVIGNRIDFEPIGPTGQVFYPQGYIQGEIVVDQGSERKPRLPTDEDGTSNGNNTYGPSTNYVQLNGPAAIRFVIPGVETFTINRMTISGSTYESVPVMSIYNNETEKWDEQILLTVAMDQEGWAPYIDGEGAVWLRYEPADATGRYEGMQMPNLSLRGEVR